MILSENYTLPELREYLKTRLGGAVWRLEGMAADNQNTLDQAISDAVLAISRRIPRYGFEVINPQTHQTYKLKNPGFGVFHVAFIEQSVIPGVLSGLNHNLVGVNQLGIGAAGAGEIAQFLTWQRSFRRSTLNDVKWFWEDDSQLLYIYSNHFQKACVYSYLPRNFDQIRLIHKDLLRKGALAQAKIQLGTIRRKFNGSIKGPGGQEISLDSDALIQEGEKEWEKFEEEIILIQPRAIPVYD